MKPLIAVILLLGVVASLLVSLSVKVHFKNAEIRELESEVRFWKEQDSLNQAHFKRMDSIISDISSKTHKPPPALQE